MIRSSMDGYFWKSEDYRRKNSGYTYVLTELKEKIERK